MPRKVWVSGTTNALVAVQLFVAQLDQPGNEIPAGSTVDRTVHINPASGPCTRYAFDGVGTASFASVTRTATKTWLVQTKPSPNNGAHCVTDGVTYYMNVSFTIQGQ